MSAAETSTITIPPPLGIEDLRQLMRSVNETTERLEHTHAALQQQVVCLQTELAEANAQLRRSRSLAALGEMAAGIAHEVRNPLGSISLYVQMLAEDVAKRPGQVQLCDKIARAVEDLDAIVRDVLLFARDTNLQAQPTTADVLIDRALDNCQSLLGEAGIQVARQVAGDSCQVDSDPGLLVQSLSNVIRNAVEAMEESATGRRELGVSASRQRCRCPDGQRAVRVVFRVTDTGPGLAPEVRKRMFNPFFTTRKTGTGLGLAIVHRIVDAHGGHVSVSNRSKGGATVELCFPPKAVAPQGSPQYLDGQASTAVSSTNGSVDHAPTTEQGA